MAELPEVGGDQDTWGAELNTYLLTGHNPDGTHIDGSSTQRVQVSKAGVLVGTRERLNLVEGSGVSLSVADNSGFGRIDVTVSAVPVDAYVATDPQWGYTTGAEIAAAAQAAINAMPTGGGTLYIPPGTWTFNGPVTLKSGVRIVGAGRGISRINALAEGMFTWTATLSGVVVEHLKLAVYDGHMFTPTAGQSLVFTVIRNCSLISNHANSSIMRHVTATGDYINVVVDDCEMYRLQTATAPGWHVVNTAGGANGNRWRGLFVHSANCTSTPFFWIESDATDNYAYDNRFEDIIGEQSAGGILRALSTTNLIVDNVQDYDTSVAYTADVIYVGKSAVSGGLRSRFPMVRNSGRRGGTLGAGVHDVNMPSGATLYGQIIAPNHSSSACRINFDTADLVTVIGAQSGTWTGQETDVTSLYAAPAKFASGLYVGATKETSGTGSPEGVVTGSVGDRYWRTNGGSASTLYVKESGTATTAGWVAYGGVIDGSAALNFPSIAAGATAELTITVTGAAAGDVVQLGPPAALEAGLMASARVSSANTVTVRLHNTTAGAVDPAAATWRCRVGK